MRLNMSRCIKKVYMALKEYSKHFFKVIYFTLTKLKSEILNDKKNYKPKCLSAVTKKLNWQILTKNLATFN